MRQQDLTAYRIRVGKALKMLRGSRTHREVVARLKELGFDTSTQQLSKYENFNPDRVLWPSTPTLLALLGALSDDGRPNLCKLQKCIEAVERGGDELFSVERSLGTISEGGGGSQTRQKADHEFGDRLHHLEEKDDARDRRIAELEEKLERVLELLGERRERDVQGNQ